MPCALRLEHAVLNQLPMNEAKAILIVDDNEDDAVFLKFAMKKAGVLNSVMVISSGEETVCYFKGEGVFADREKYPLPFILFLDLQMRGLDGFQILEWLREQPHLKPALVAIVTGDWEMRGANRASELGAQSFLVKPCKPLDILKLTRAFPEHWMMSP
ncbi:MAG: response regulator receiver protein [Pedosphaera sp.]|nr:response regulator receiver protein [Pedosphaera sp.]